MRFAIRLLPGMLLLSWAACVRAELVPSPRQLNFPVQTIFTTSPPTETTLTNNGNQTLTVVSVVAQMPVSGAYARAGGSCGATPFTIAAQANCTIAHTFTPTGVQAFYQTIRLTLAGGDFVDFGLGGEGDQGRLEISPSTLLFTSVPVGTVGAQLTALLSNKRSVPLEITHFVPIGAVNAFVRTGGTCPQPPIQFTAVSSCTISYAFMPAEIGKSSLDLSFRSSTAGGGDSLSLIGEGLPGNVMFEDGFEARALAP